MLSGAGRLLESWLVDQFQTCITRITMHDYEITLKQSGTGLAGGFSSTALGCDLWPETQPPANQVFSRGQMEHTGIAPKVSGRDGEILVKEGEETTLRCRSTMMKCCGQPTLKCRPLAALSLWADKTARCVGKVRWPDGTGNALDAADSGRFISG
jgi:hypothetical protein